MAFRAIPSPSIVYVPNDDIHIPLTNLGPFAEDTVFVCYDVECHCRPPPGQRRMRNTERRVCEIGFTIVDSRELKNIMPGDRYENAWSRMRSFNVAIVENRHQKYPRRAHPDWCSVGDAEDFLLGPVQWFDKAHVKEAVLAKIQEFVPKDRKIVFLTFSGVNDKVWLRSLDIDFDRDFPGSDYLDIQFSNLAQLLAEGRGRPREKISARHLFTQLGLLTPIQHNGGNDAAYEMQAFLAPFALTTNQWNVLRCGGQLPVQPWSTIARALEDPRFHQPAAPPEW